MKTDVLAITFIALVAGGVVGGFLLALSTLQPSASSAFPEYLVVSNVDYGIGSHGWITIAVNNTGIGSVTLVKILVNGVKQTSVTPSFPITVGSDEGVIINVTMETVPGEDYLIDLFTSRGNKFSTLSSIPLDRGQTGVRLYKSNVWFYIVSEVKKIDVCIGNSGDANTGIMEAYVGTSPTDLQDQMIDPVVLWAGGLATITFDYAWEAGATYYFKVVCLSGQTLEWPEQAPVYS